MTVTGKVQKFKLRELAIEELGLRKAAAIRTAWVVDSPGRRDTVDLGANQSCWHTPAARERLLAADVRLLT